MKRQLFLYASYLPTMIIRGAYHLNKRGYKKTASILLIPMFVILGIILLIQNHFEIYGK